MLPHWLWFIDYMPCVNAINSQCLHYRLFSFIMSINCTIIYLKLEFSYAIVTVPLCITTKTLYPSALDKNIHSHHPVNLLVCTGNVISCFYIPNRSPGDGNACFLCSARPAKILIIEQKLDSNLHETIGQWGPLENPRRLVSSTFIDLLFTS